jgi:hypothetical protein
MDGIAEIVVSPFVFVDFAQLIFFGRLVGDGIFKFHSFRSAISPEVEIGSLDSSLD